MKIKLLIPLSFLYLGLYSQNLEKNITGKIIDSKSIPIPNTMIQIFNKTTFIIESQTFSDKNGDFKISNFKPLDSNVLILQAYGFTVDTINISNSITNYNITLKEKIIDMQEVIISLTLAKNKTPVPLQEIKMEQIEINNLGTDIPILLDQTVSMVTTSNSGGGIGYTGLRIRGSDPTRVNITINGIPLNDPESQGVYWVNMPDFASSLNSIQIQRGVGSSTNGTGAFGATVNLNTFKKNIKPYANINSTYGSFDTKKQTIEFGTGLIQNKYYLNGRLSKINSDGYIDRSSSDLQSYYISGGVVGKSSHFKILTFNGLEETYQSWYGTPESKIKLGNRTYNPYNYQNQIDHYNQNHVQLHYVKDMNKNLQFTISQSYTAGKGYYEEYKGNQFNQDIFTKPASFSSYNLDDVIINNDTITETNLIRRRFLDNKFYATVYSLDYTNQKFNITFGGSYTNYEGQHFGEIIWSQYSSNGNKNHRWYDGIGEKIDLNNFLKVNYKISNKLSITVDLQNRKVEYKTHGIDNDLRKYDIKDKLNFFNPKGGIFYSLNKNNNIFTSVSIANREPTRNDYIDRDFNISKPKHESMIDYEFGYKYHGKKYSTNFNVYYMNYSNQLVLTGEVNDVGNSIRQNVDKSYRRGMEFEFIYQPLTWFVWNVNATFSQNKIKTYKQYIYSWDSDNYPKPKIYNYENTDIAFSPSIIAANTFEFTPSEMFLNKKKYKLQVALISKYVGKQYLDNTQSDLRSLQSYLVNDIRITFTTLHLLTKEITFNILLRNVFNEQYASNGWVYRFRHPDALWGKANSYDIYAVKDTELNNSDPNDVYYFEKGLYNQALFNFLVGISIKL